MKPKQFTNSKTCSSLDARPRIQSGELFTDLQHKQQWHHWQRGTERMNYFYIPIQPPPRQSRHFPTGGGKRRSLLRLFLHVLKGSGWKYFTNTFQSGSGVTHLHRALKGRMCYSTSRAWKPTVTSLQITSENVNLLMWIVKFNWCNT